MYGVLAGLLGILGIVLYDRKKIHDYFYQQRETKRNTIQQRLMEMKYRRHVNNRKRNQESLPSAKEAQAEEL